MKKAYLVFALLLLMLVVIFLVVRNYVSFQAEEARERETRQLIATELDEFKITVDSRIDESEQSLLARLDSLAYILEEPPELDTFETDTTLVDSDSVETVAVDTITGEKITAGIDSVDSVSAADTAMSYEPSEQDNEIYIRYLKKRWALPNDLTKYELAVAKQEIMSEVGKDYGMNADEILGVIDRVYEYRKSHKGEKN